MIGEAPVEVMRAKARRGGPLGPLDAGPAALGACGVRDAKPSIADKAMGSHGRKVVE
jgi:hypothetical protein